MQPFRILPRSNRQSYANEKTNHRVAHRLRTAFESRRQENKVDGRSRSVLDFAPTPLFQVLADNDSLVPKSPRKSSFVKVLQYRKSKLPRSLRSIPKLRNRERSTKRPQLLTQTFKHFQWVIDALVHAN